MSDSDGRTPEQPSHTPALIRPQEVQPRSIGQTAKSRWTAGFTDILLVQCAAAEGWEASSLVAERVNAGLVLSGSQAPCTARALKEHGFDKPLLCDAERYRGKNRAPADAEFDAQWISKQRELGIPVLTDSGYLGVGDVRGLESILHRSAQLGEDVIACLPVHSSWLTNSASLEHLQEAVRNADVAVALVLEHQKDPLGVQNALRGLLRFLGTATKPVLLLRSDVSALGALCFGASAAAVGTTSARRHLYPCTSGGPARAPQVSVLVKHCLSYVGANKLAAAVQATPDQADQWACTCRTCSGRMMDHFATIRGRKDADRAAFGHSLEKLLDVHDELFSRRRTQRQRQNSWIQQCSAAGFYHQDVESLLPRRWNPPPFLNTWQSVGTEFLAADVNQAFPRR